MVFKIQILGVLPYFRQVQVFKVDKYNFILKINAWLYILCKLLHLIDLYIITII
jgi:hypothetical protein